MKRLVFATVMALIIFGMLNVVYCNLDNATLGYDIVFKFKIPWILDEGVQTKPIPLGFVLVAVFCFGMVFIALLEAIPSIYKSLDLRAKNKRIRELERELNVSRQLARVDKSVEEEKG